MPSPPICCSSWDCWPSETRPRPSLVTQTCCRARQSGSVLALAGEADSSSGMSKSAASVLTPRASHLVLPRTCCPVLPRTCWRVGGRAAQRVTLISWASGPLAGTHLARRGADWLGPGKPAPVQSPWRRGDGRVEGLSARPLSPGQYLPAQPQHRPVGIRDPVLPEVFV